MFTKIYFVSTSIAILLFFENLQGVVNGDMAYGGVWRSYVQDVTYEEEARLKQAAQFAVAFAIKRSPHTVAINPDSDDVEEYSIARPRILRVQFTADDLQPYEYPAIRGGQEVMLPVIWGLTFTFQLTFAGSFTHVFAATEHIDGSLFILQHTFHTERPSDAPDDHRDSVTDSQCDGVTDSQCDGVTDSQCDSGTDSQCDGVTDRQCDSGTDSQCDGVTDSQCDGGTDSQCDSVTGSQCDSGTDSQCDGVTGSQHDSVTDSQCDSGTDSQCDSVTDSQCDSVTYNQCDSVANNQYDSMRNQPDHVTAIPSYLSTDKTVALRILTYNIWNTNTSPGQDYVKRIRQLARFCRSSQADVIAFQEVRFDSTKSGRLGPNQVEHLAALLTDYQFVFQPAQIQLSDVPHRVEEGVAVFSRHPILYTDYTLLSRDPSDPADSHQRVLLHAVIALHEFGQVHVLTTHLSLSHVARQRSVVEAWNVVKALKEPVFISGDFNAEGHNSEIRFLSGHESLHGEVTTDLIDVWEEVHGPQAQSGGFTFNTLDPHLTKRLDFLFMKRHPQVKISNITLWDDKRRRSQASSDHIGLLTTVQLEIN